MKIAIIYDNNKEYIDKLIEYNPIILLKDIEKLKELENYNLIKRNIKYDIDTYDILISNTDDIRNISSIKKVVIGDKGNNPRITYLDKFDIKKIFEKTERKDYKFSIIIPNYNNAGWIDKTIESVLNQTYKNWEMFIIDDMSTDNSIEIIKKYKDSRITLIENKIKWYNGGSRNWGILKAKESNPDGYIIFIDSDDFWDNKNFLEDLNNFSEDEDLITYEYKYFMDNKIQPAGHFSYQNIDDLFMTNGIICACWCKAVKTKLMPLFSFNTLMEDRVHWYRTVNRIKTFVHFNKYQIYVWNKMNTKSVTSNKEQRYGNEIQSAIDWKSCSFRHIADQYDLLNELNNPKWKQFIENKIAKCKTYIKNGEYLQY